MLFLQAMALYGQDNTDYPIFNCDWTSTWGKIYWTISGDQVTGWYGTENKLLTGTLEKDLNGTYVLRGEWSRKNNPNKRGGFSFVFDSPTSFKGTYWYEGNPDATSKWKGACKNRGSAADIKPANYPDFDCEWTSTYGTIRWSVSGDLIMGWYGEGDEHKTLAGTLLKSKSGNFVLEGAWGDRDNASEKGGFHFTFDSAHSFKGNFWHGHDHETLVKWKGSCGEE